MQSKRKVIRTSTIPIALNNLLRGQLSFLNRYYEVVAVSGEGEHLREVEKREKVRVVPLLMHRSIKPLHDLVSLWKLYVLFRREKPFLVHSITPKAGLLTMTAGWLARVPIRIHTFTGLIFPYKTGAMQRLLILMDKLLCRFATNIYPEGEGVRNDLVNFKITKKPLKVIGNGNINGIDTSFYNDNHLTEAQKVQLRGDLSIEPDDFVFLFVGRLVRDKGIGELVSAFVEICETNKRVKLLLVGNYEDDLDPLPQETVRILESDPNIITTGFQAEIRQFYAISNVNVLPSYREGFPNVVMQAGAMGLPSIVTNISGSNEIIVDRENGLIVPSKDVQALKEAMQSVIDDRELLQHLTLNSRRAIVSRYDQQELWQAVLAEYKRLETARS